MCLEIQQVLSLYKVSVRSLADHVTGTTYLGRYRLAGAEELGRSRPPQGLVRDVALGDFQVKSAHDSSDWLGREGQHIYHLSQLRWEAQE